MPVRGDNSLFFATGLDNSALRSGSLDAQQIISGLASKISKINPFAALAVGAVAAFSVIAKSAFNLARSFEQAMKEVQTISKAAQDDFKGVSSDIFNLSNVTPEDPVRLARAYYQIVSAGNDGAEALKLLEISAKAAIAGVTDTETAADGITTVMNAFGVAMEDAQQVADSMFKTVELGKTTFSELAKNISQAAPLAAASGVSFNEVLAAVASLTKQGVPTAQAMTQIRSALEATNEVLGDGWSNAFTLQEAFQELFDTAGGSQKELKELTGRAEAMSAILAVAGKNADGAADDLQKLSNSTGSASAAFTRMSTSNVNQWQLLRNRIKGATEDLGNFALEVSSGIARSLNFLLKNFNAVSQSMEKQRINLLALQLELNEANTSEERRIEIFDLLRERYPEILGNINQETTSMDELNEAIDRVNKSLIDKITLQLKEEEITKEAEDAGNVQLSLLEAETKLRSDIVSLAQRAGVELDKNVDITENALKVSRALLEQEKEQGFRGGIGGTALVFDSDKLRGQVTQIKNYREELKELQTSVTDLTRQRNEIKITLGLDNEEEVKSVLEKEISEQFEIIANAKKRAELAPFLKSENEKIRLAAEDRIKHLKSLYTPKLPEDGNFKEFLDSQLKEYEAYEAVRNQIGVEAANEQFKSLLKEGRDYGEFLENQLKKTEDFARKRAIALSAEEFGAVLNREKIDKLIIDPKPINLEINIDTKSLNNLERELADLREDFGKAQTKSDQRQIAARIKEKEKEVEQTRDLINTEKELYDQLYSDITQLTVKEVFNRIRAKKKELERLLKMEGDYIKEVKQLQDEILEAEEEISFRIDGIAGKITEIFGTLSNLFSEFGANDLAELTSQLSGVVSGAANLAKGIATNNPLDIINGVTGIIDSVITVEIVSDTAKFEAVVDRLRKAVDDLDYAISQSIGDERIANREEAIEQLRQLEFQARKAEQAEARARKEVKVLGITVGRKGAGSGTDPRKLEELADQAVEARRRVKELNDEINEIFTGTTSQNIADSILDGLLEGKRGAEEFADDFGRLIENALGQSLKTKFLERVTADFFENFADAVESDGGLSKSEFDDLREAYNAIINQSSEEIDALNQILQSAGIAATESQAEQPQGLRGEISTITEDTATVLAGTLSSIRADVSTGVQIARQSASYLALISDNSFEMVDEMKSANDRLRKIEEALS